MSYVSSITPLLIKLRRVTLLGVNNVIATLTTFRLADKLVNMSVTVSSSASLTKTFNVLMEIGLIATTQFSSIENVFLISNFRHRVAGR